MSDDDVRHVKITWHEYELLRQVSDDEVREEGGVLTINGTRSSGRRRLTTLQRKGLVTEAPVLAPTELGWQALADAELRAAWMGHTPRRRRVRRLVKATA